MSEDAASEAEWVEKARQVARAVLRSRHPGMSDAEFEKSWSISGPEWRWQYLAGVRAGFHAAGLHKAAEIEWRPIETAPKMKTVLLWAIVDTLTGNWKMQTGALMVGYSGEPDLWEWGGRRLRPYDAQPTHWMPLPGAPK